MFKNMYDTDITTWSPYGRIYQIEYAIEASKQGSATVGVKSKTHVVLVALKRAPTEQLSSYCEKVFQLDEHLGMSVTGLIADARELARYMRQMAMSERYMTGSAIGVRKISGLIGEEHQERTMTAGSRPFGVGLLIAGTDRDGTHLFQTSPSGDVFDFKATAIGSRSQSARTYLERHFESFSTMALDDLVMHALKALANTTGEGAKLTPSNTTVAIVGVDHRFTVYTEDSARRWLDTLVVLPEDTVAAAVDEELADVAAPSD